MFKSLRYYWRINLAVLFAGAVACAVLTGALLVGDSVRYSLRDLTLSRLGKIDQAVISEGLFREKLASEIESTSQFRQSFWNPTPVLLLRGSAVHGVSKQRASQVQITGVDFRFFDLFSFSSDLSRNSALDALSKKLDQIFPSVLINMELAKELNTKPGDALVFSFRKESSVSSESVLGYKDPSETIRSLRLIVKAILPDQGLGRFGLSSNQNLPLNAFISLPVLQKAMDQNGRVNAILLSVKQPHSAKNLSALQTILSRNVELEDLGLQTRESRNYFILESKEVILKDAVSRLANGVAGSLKLSQQSIFTYLANEITGTNGSVPYSTIAALQTPVPSEFGFLKKVDGSPVPELKEDEIVLNEWAAKNMKAQQGDSIRILYYVAGPGNQLITQQHEFILRAITSMEGLGIDQKLTPEYPGIEEADHISEWAPPFPVDLSRIRPVDEKYWDQYKAAPKAFISLKAGQALWKSRFGSLSSIRLAPASAANVRRSMLEFGNAFLQKANPQEFGFSFQPVKEQGLQAADGSTDFGGLFIGFSIFLIISASLLVALLFRLGVELRAKELGLLLSVGYNVKQVRSKFLAEGLFLAVVGALLGLCGAVLYAWLLLSALKTWWLAAVGSPFLTLHIHPLSLIIGFLMSVILVGFSIWRSVARLSRVPPPSLLNGVTSNEEISKSRRNWKWIGIGFFLAACLLSLYAFVTNKTSSPELFFLIGSFYLVTGLIFFSVWLRLPHRKTITPKESAILFRMALRNSVRNPGRSLLSAALVCCACFVIVAVGANRAAPQSETSNVHSGTGGYSLVAESDVPLPQDPNLKEARLAVGLPASIDYQFTSFRLLPGDDVSCLNLYKPQKPRILGVPESQIDRGGFLFSDSLASTAEEKENPWLLLNRSLENGVIPAIGDANSVKWILHLGLGQEMQIADGFGRPLRLRIVGLLKGSIFQSELLVSNTNFLRHFPNQGGYSYFLIETKQGKQAEIAKTLEGSLSDFGLDAMSTSEKLASYQVVENTYLSTFQTLGGLGLLLGTLGLGIILVRNVIERRGELATLRAFGYERSTLAMLVLVESGILLFIGIAIGSVSAWIAVTPHILLAGSAVSWQSLLMTLLLVFFTGMIASFVATAVALRVPLLPALKAE